MDTLAAALTPAAQHYLLQARQMQALSLAGHIPLVCFGIAFPALVLFCEWRFRTVRAECLDWLTPTVYGRSTATRLGSGHDAVTTRKLHKRLHAHRTLESEHVDPERESAALRRLCRAL